MGSNVPNVGPGSDGMAGAFILLGSLAGLIACGLLIALACMAVCRGHSYTDDRKGN